MSKVDDSYHKAWGNIELTYCSLSGVESTRCLQCSCWTVEWWVSEPECWCLFGWPFCLLSSCVVDGSPVRRDAVVYLPLFHLAILRSTSAPSRTHSFSALARAPSSSFYSSFSSSPSLSLSQSLPACFFPSSPLLSFPAKRLAGVFSTVVTFKTECHHCLSHSVSSLPLTCLSL